MRPNRAAWLFAVGLAWLVLRGLLAQTFPVFGTEQAVSQGGFWLLVPLASVLASVAVPLFFFSFLRHHGFESQSGLQVATAIALAASILSSVLVILSFVDAVRGAGAAGGMTAARAPWLLQAAPAAFIVSVFAYLVAFAVQCRCPRHLRRNALVASVGALVPILLVSAWLVHGAGDGLLPWFPAFSRSPFVKVLGLAAAGTLLFFLERFAVGYDPDATGRTD
jgi:hypothetical protein